MFFPTNILHSQGKETKTQLFTRPLRGVLGGKDYTLGSDDKGKKIMKVWQRAMLGTVLFTVGLPYTAVAGTILRCSKAKNKIEASIKEELSPDDIKVLSYLFDGTDIDLKDIQISQKLYEVDLGKQGGAEEHFQEMLQFEQPTLMKLKFTKTGKTYDNLIVPVEMKNEKREWERSVAIFRHHPEDREQTSSWSCRLGKSKIDAELPLFQLTDAASIQSYKDLLSGKVAAKDGVEFRLFIQ